MAEPPCDAVESHPGPDARGRRLSPGGLGSRCGAYCQEEAVESCDAVVPVQGQSPMPVQGHDNARDVAACPEVPGQHLEVSVLQIELADERCVNRLTPGVDGMEAGAIGRRQTRPAA